MAQSETEKRPYNQTRRAENAAETRRRILDAGRDCLTEKPLRRLNMDEIARRAGVSRSTLHLIYRSKADFFVALAKEMAVESGFDKIVTSLDRQDARQALEDCLANLIQGYDSAFPFIRAFVALTALEPEVEAALKDLRGLRVAHSEYLIRRLKEQGYIDESLTQDEGADILCMMMAFETFSDLRLRRHLSTEQISERLLALAKRALGLHKAPFAPGSRQDGMPAT